MWLNSIDIPFNLFKRDLDAFQPGNCTTHDRFVSNDFLTSLIFFDSFVNSINKHYWSHYPLFFIDKSACTNFIDCWSCYSYLKWLFYICQYLLHLVGVDLVTHILKDTFIITSQHLLELISVDLVTRILKDIFIFSSILIMIWKRSWEIFFHPLFLIWFLMRAAISFSHLKFKSEVISYDYSPLNKRQNIFCIFKDMSTVFVLSVLNCVMLNINDWQN